MKSVSTIGVISALAAWAGGTVATVETPALWEGRSSQIEWVGLSPSSKATRVVPVLTKVDVGESTEPPTWVGYFKRSGDWYVRLRCEGVATVESLKLGEHSSDGWEIFEIETKPTGVSSVSVRRKGLTQRLLLQK